MKHVSGIIIHQTHTPTVKKTFEVYEAPGAKGAHFLIGKDGTIYQTASIYKKTWHVGPLRARCLAENTCTPTEIPSLKKMLPTARHRHEAKKKYPKRYPMNEDSIGIELVGKAFLSEDPKEKDLIFESVTDAQNTSLKWLVFELSVTLQLPMTEAFRHPVVSQKTPTEASTAQW
jgi:N-acetyl-anhydromuramyl-L-alanine amidase AmpD